MSFIVDDFVEKNQKLDQSIYLSIVLQSAREQSKLYCYYKSDRPFLRLAPIKTEVLRFRPLTAIFRNVISEYEISVVKALATPQVCSFIKSLRVQKR